MPYMGYYGIDMYYIVLVLPCVLFAFWAQSQVNGTFNRYSRVMSRRGLTGAQAAQAVLRANGVTGVNIEYVAGKLTDHFDPRTNTIRLSASVYQSTSVASIGVAAHEAGHAVQYAVGYSPIRLRNAIVPLTQVGATAAMPLILMGLVLNFGVLIKVGIIAFALSTVFQLVTLPCFATAIMYAGAISFFVSDSILFYVRFRKGRPFKTHFGVMLTYLLAEFLIVSGFILLAA